MNLDQAFFLAIALFGALFLLVSFVIGEVGDFFDSVGDFASGGGEGLITGFIAYKLMQMLHGQQASSVVEISGLVGRQGIIDLSIPAAGLGRVTVDTGAGQTTLLARAEGGQPIAAGERVLIKGSIGSDLIVAKAPEGVRG